MHDSATCEMSPSITVGELSARLGVEAPESLAGREIHGINTLELAGAGEVAYVTREKYFERAKDSGAEIVIAPEGGAPLDREGVLRVPDVMAAVLALLEHFHPDPPEESYTDPSASVHPGAEIGKRVYLGPNTVVAEGARIGAGTRVEAFGFIGPDARIGERCLLWPRVTVLERCEVGDRARLHSGVVIGADGFRYEQVGGRLRRVPQVGTVVLEDDVEVGANSTIDRAALAETRVGARTKIDNMVHIGHNCRIGPDCIIVAQVGVAGSTTIGRGVVIAGQAGIGDNLTIGDGARIAGGSGVHENLPAGARVAGYPAIPAREFAAYLRFYRHFSKHWKRLRQLLDVSR